MNETDLITRYRPKDWNEFIGNDATVKSLMDSVDTNNAHQYLLVGPSGCGKTTAARIMAKEFGCDNPFELDAAANNSVDDMRSIIEELRYKMVLGGKNKVYIIDECFSPEHELLTRSGWKPIAEISKNEEVMAFNAFTDVLQFEQVTDTISRKNTSGYLVSVAGQKFHTLTTPNHEQPFKTRVGKVGRCRISDLTSGRLLPIAGYIRSEINSALTNFERLKIAYEADGTLVYTSKSNVYTYRFAFIRERKIKRLLDILSSIGITPSQSKNSRGDTLIWFKSSVVLQKSLSWFDPTVSVNRNNEFLDELVEWDGHKRNDGCCLFDHINENTAELVQLTATLSGKWASCKLYHNKQHVHPRWRVFWNSKNKTWAEIVQSAEITRIPYEDNVYCVSVPSGNLLTRLNKDISISGNCHMLSKAAWNSILKSVEEPPEYVYWIFCTTDVGRVLPTIKTRCFTAEFKPLPIDDIYNLIEQICIKEEFKTADTIMAVCAEQANGSPRQSIANLAKCWNVKDDKDAYELLKAVGENSDVVDLVKALIEAKPWPTVLKIINKLEEPNAESVRRVAQAYLTKVILNTDKEERVKALFPILDAFAEPFRDEGMSPLVLACGGILFGH